MKKTNFSKLQHWVAPCIVIFLLLGGFLLRMIDLTDPPLDFHPTRQLHSAIIARGMYAQMQAKWPLVLTFLKAPNWEGANLSFIEETQRQQAISLWHSSPIFEPQIFERLVALTYCLLGAEVLWIARIYAAIFWVLGSLPLFALARRVTSFEGGIVALAFYLFLPLSVYASRSFQPDPLMVALILYSAYLTYRWGEEKTWKLAILTGIISGLAVLVKAPAAFPVGLFLAFTALAGWRFKNAIRSIQVWLVAGIAILIPAVYYLFLKEGRSSGYLAYWSGSFSRMLLEPGFYIRWLVFLKQNVVEISIFFIGLAGATLFTLRGKAIAWGLWLGYSINGFVLPYLISTHDYYSLPLIPAIAFSLAPFASIIIQAVARQPKLWQGVFYAVLVFAMFFPAWISRSSMIGTDYRQEVLGWQAMGQELPKDKRIIAITHDYGNRLRYYGWIAVDLWPSTAEQNLSTLRSDQSSDVTTQFTQLTQGYGYFLITLPKELEAQKQLSDILFTNYPLLINQKGFILFDLNPIH